MIELTEEQMLALSQLQTDPLQMDNPRTREAFVLFPVDQYKKLTGEPYDDSSWTREELEFVAWQTAARSGAADEDGDAVEAH